MKNLLIVLGVLCLCSIARADGIGGGVGGANGIGSGIGDPNGIASEKINLTPFTCTTALLVQTGTKMLVNTGSVLCVQ